MIISKSIKAMLVLLMFSMVFASCSTSKKSHKRKDCDCPKWSKNNTELLHYDQGSV